MIAPDAASPPVPRPLPHGHAVALLCLCTVCWSLAGVGTRLLDRAEGFEITFWRSVFCIVGVAVALVWQERGRALRPVFAMGRAGVISGAMWAVMFTCFMLALTRTSVANTLLVSSLSPLIAALLAWLVLRERIGAGTWVAIAAALAGIWWMVRGGVSAEGASGMLIALGVPVAAAVNLVVLKRMHAHVDLAPAVLLGGVFSCVATLPLAWPLSATAHDLAILAFLGVVQLALPCMLLVRVARSLPPQEIALIALLEVVLGPIWAWVGAGEAMSRATIEGGLIVLGALAVNEFVAWHRRRAIAGA